MSRDKGNIRLVIFILEINSSRPSFKVILHYLALSRKPWPKEQYLSDCQEKKCLDFILIRQLKREEAVIKLKQDLCFQIPNKSGETQQNEDDLSKANMCRFISL